MDQKNKKVQYLLVVLVLIIWGAVAMQFFNYTGSQSDSIDNSYAYRPNMQPQKIEGFNFQLSLDYNDPFFTSQQKNNAVRNTQLSNAKKQINKSLKQKINPQRKQKIPQVVYKGFSLNNNKITRVSLSVNRKIISMQPGDIEDGLLLKKVYKDSILVSFMGQEQMVFRTK